MHLKKLSSKPKKKLALCARSLLQFSKSWSYFCRKRLANFVFLLGLKQKKAAILKYFFDMAVYNNYYKNENKIEQLISHILNITKTFTIFYLIGDFFIFWPSFRNALMLATFYTDLNRCRAIKKMKEWLTSTSSVGVRISA